jgi:hypothetical protein
MFVPGIPIFLLLAVPFILQSRQRLATAGAILLAMSAWFGYFEWLGIERCAEMNRRPNASCQMYGVEGAVVATGLLAVAGLALSLSSSPLRRRASAATSAG